ncbi:ancylostoma secreted protein-like [Aethina tumida]|uniref:ancylostoma secreted protein-like n=1 Tax=Aethina tumida TaxID=116153 RepID=UPI0021476DD6|nr:ancylostoma secreted protein-like [Aethina tumida]
MTKLGLSTLLLSTLLLLSTTVLIQATTCLKTLAKNVSKEDKITIVNKHNELRLLVAQGKITGQPKAINMKKLSWDDCLAKKSQKLADSCFFGHKLITCDTFWWVGENYHISQLKSDDSNAPDWNTAIQSWFDENAVYTYNNVIQKAAGHYTQVVWAETTKVGCGYTYYKTDLSSSYLKYYFCAYGEGGNIPGEYPYQNGTSGFLSTVFVLINVYFVFGACPNGTLNQGVTSEEQDLIVSLHNGFRLEIANGTVSNQPRGINLKRMKWDSCLASEAQRIANTCEFKHQEVTCSAWSAIGQNLYTSSSTSGSNKASDWRAATTSWFNEHKVYTYSSTYNSNAGHYTQMVWASTDRVGCGWTYYTDSSKFKYKKLYVCNYAPAGNYVGEYPYKTGDSGCENLC